MQKMNIKLEGADSEISQKDFYFTRALLVIVLGTLGGITILISVTAMQDFKCRMLNDTSIAEAAVDTELMFLGILQDQFEPILPGIMPGKTRPKLVLAAEPTWAPYAYINPQQYTMEGIAVDFAKGMSELCDLDVEITETKWTECWTDQVVGRGILNGHYHGCMTYTYTKGTRDRQLDFSHAFLKNDKFAGLLVRLADDGTPEIDGNHNLAGKKVVNVNGWAPTEDALGFVLNACTGERFEGYEMVTSSTQLPNDDALAKLLDGTVDAMFVYMDQGENYMNAGCIADVPDKTSSSPEWDCAKWAQFGKKFAFVQSGLFGHSVNGTTLTISKKGSGVSDIVNPCMERFMRTEEYYKVCSRHGMELLCYPNAHFPDEYFSDILPAWETATNITQCQDGYCPCPS
mmetsp:Transcript_6086/g.11639  ORF Transcript_6086/g.11639 Transcript_6086/m.11639 type:complete len:402 (-) Transcript_6086:246-1451(-)